MHILAHVGSSENIVFCETVVKIRLRGESIYISCIQCFKKGEEVLVRSSHLASFAPAKKYEDDVLCHAQMDVACIILGCHMAI